MDTAPTIVAKWPTSEIDKIEAYLRERAEMVQAGVKRCPEWFLLELMQIDSKLRCWWDAWKEEWVIDRFQSEGIVEGLLRLAETESADVKQSLRESASGLLARGQYYLTIIHFHPTPEMQLDRAFLDMLRSMDMQRYRDPAQYLAEKRRKAEAVEKSNDNAMNDAALAQVDKLSDKQVHEFLEVSRALGTGETITCHGEAEKFMDSIEEARRKGPPMPINKPSVFRPKRRGYK